MRVLLIYPRWDYPTFGEPQEPLGIICVGAALKEAGHEVLLVDLTVQPIEEVDRGIRSADAVCISSSTALYGRACRVLDRVKGSRPQLPVILGGPHATVLGGEALERGFDAAVAGEGECTAVELMEALERGRPLCQVPGVRAVRDGEVVYGGPRRFAADLDELPDPDRCLIDYEKYFDMGLTHIGLMATRGCPWNCLFCKPMQDELFGRRVRRRSIKRIAAEMARLAELFGKRNFLFRDDTLALAGPGWFRDLKAELSLAGLSDVSWSCQARVDQISEDILSAMKDAGLRGMAFGVESGSQKVLDFYRKGIRVEQTVRAFDLCREAGIGTHAFIMLGAPVETREDLDKTVGLVERIKPNSVSVSIATPAPGTAFHDYAVERDILNVDDPEEFDYQFNFEPVNLSRLTAPDLARAERAILDAVPGTSFREQMEARMEGLSKRSLCQKPTAV